MLSVQRVRPVISRWSSLRRRSRPISLAASAGRSWVAVTGHLLRWSARGRRRVLHGLHDVVVARAAAQVALEPEPDLLLGGVRVLLQQVDALHDHPGRAEAALQPVALPERLLDRVQLPVRGQPLDRRDVGAVGLDRQHVAGLDAAAVQVDGARPAVAGVAPDDGAGLPETLTEVLHEQHPWFDVVGDRCSVDVEADTGHGRLPALRGCDEAHAREAWLAKGWRVWTGGCASAAGDREPPLEQGYGGVRPARRGRPGRPR